MTPWTVAIQAPLSTEFSRPEYWSGLPFPSPGDLPDPGIKTGPPALQADSLPTEPLGKPYSLYYIIYPCSLFILYIIVVPLNFFYPYLAPSPLFTTSKFSIISESVSVLFYIHFFIHVLDSTFHI